ncbi:MAG TPA: hypothetical protein DEP45_10780 [Armatimonadetes bacterium]|nr:hypothetical protein [Armatimonadota bacterium]
MTAAAVAAPDPAEEFSACVAAYQASIAGLRQTEERMRQALAQMQAQGAPRERLIAASSILQELRGTLRSYASLPEVCDVQRPAMSHRAA